MLNIVLFPISELKTNEESKLSFCSSIKTCYRYEPYLDYHPGCIYLAKFRLSVHYLPIERGRYHIPKLPRDMRICTLCKTGVGDEIHALFECKNEEMKSYNDQCHQYIARMEVISSQISHLSNKDKFIYIYSNSFTYIYKCIYIYIYREREICIYILNMVYHVPSHPKSSQFHELLFWRNNQVSS